ncbi:MULTISPECIES: hypothetical protein [Corynebacterium]|uniref:hypothetical protein n=1 Tax=Corynebacterium TaxID=1716 RepID=UPI0003F5C6C5|nr:MULTISPECIES: hypothetical protein [Corynebacterium]MCT1409418.1 hypothetical protein [Corynebacterium accolens]MDK4246136.1 hypothetical protein [Corynebacterium accolens]MDK4261440.1 hypothetical protein [Corynebacterium accolens]
MSSAFSQFLVQAPVWVQMIIVVIVVVPIMIGLAWCLMWAVDRSAALISQFHKRGTTVKDHG